MTRLHRSRLSLATGVVLVAPLLASCGFDYPTDRVNTISAGVSDRSGVVKVLGAVIIAGEEGTGLFVATLVNNDVDNPIVFTGLQQTDTVAPIADDAAPADGEGESDEVAGTIGRGGRLNLITEGGIPVSGGFAPGDFVPVTLGFDNGQTTTLEVNVVPPCRQYDPETLGVELPAPAKEPNSVFTGSPDGGYDCEPLPQVEHHAEAEPEGGAEE